MMKMAAASAIDGDAVLIADSDAVLVRHIQASDLLVDGKIGYYRVDDGVAPHMRRHVLWHGVARRLLRLPEAVGPLLPDYVSAMCVWDSTVLHQLKSRLEQVGGRSWLDVVAAELHVSEFVLYGVFADDVLGNRPALRKPLCHDYYDRVPLDAAGARIFADRMPQGACGAMITSHSGTPRDIRAAAFQRCRGLAAERAVPDS